MAKVAGNLKSYMDSKCRRVSKVAFEYNTGKTYIQIQTEIDIKECFHEVHIILVFLQIFYESIRSNLVSWRVRIPKNYFGFPISVPTAP